MNLKRRGITSYHALPDAEVQQRSGSARNLSGVFAPIAATVHPCKLVRGLLRVVIGMGIRIYERTPMLSFMPGPTGTLHPPRWLAARFTHFRILSPYYRRR